MKRSAFGDLSNTAGAKASHSIHTKGSTKCPVNTSKMIPYKYNDKENAIKVGKAKDAFLRPAQRPPTGLKPSSTAQSFPAQNDIRGGPVFKQTIPKKTTVVYNDEHQQKPQALGRQYHSQPYLKPTVGTVLHRKQSRKISQEGGHHNAEADIDEASYEDVMDELSQYQEDHVPLEASAPGPIGPAITADMKPLEPLPATSSVPWAFSMPLVPEPEDYSDEDYEEDLYDEQGYTKAHSIKSFGDYTGGVTALLVPDMTAKAQQELEEAKVYVEKNRPLDDVEDEEWDVSMVAEYGEEIFEYMRELEVSPMKAS